MIIVLITLFLKRFLIDKVIHFQSENRIDKESYLVELSLPFLIFSSFAVGIRVCCTTSLKEEYFLEQLALNY